MTGAAGDRHQQFPTWHPHTIR